MLNKTPMHHSNKYDNAPMPFAQFFESHGIAMHAGFNPGHPASHGCIRLPSAFAKKLYSVDRHRDAGLHRRVTAEGRAA